MRSRIRGAVSGGSVAPAPVASTNCSHPETRKERRIFFLYASLAGMFGALSAVVGKLAVADDNAEWLSSTVESLRFSIGGKGEVEMIQISSALLALRVLLFAFNAFSTAQMWRWYLKALSYGPTPVCQIINTGTNFALSALFGLVVFHEEITFTWAVGALLVVLGLALVVTDPDIPLH